MGSIPFPELIELIFILFGFPAINERCPGLKSETTIPIPDVSGTKKIEGKNKKYYITVFE